ncbi:MAG: ribonuclease III [Leadbetterella sp.]
MINSILSLFNKEDAEFGKQVKQIIGSLPSNIVLYKLAFRHTSSSKTSNFNGFRESNERLEYLGDSVLGMVVAEYLFKKYPYKDEGFLTEIRSRIVNRESLNSLAKKIGLDKLIEFDGQRNVHRSSMFGDAMEALIGAIYLDKGFIFTRKFIVSELLSHHFDLNEVISKNNNYKSQLLGWAQADGKKVEFVIVEENGKNHSKEFVAQVLVNGDVVGSGSGWNKKKAEQDASRKACIELGIAE